MPRERSDTQARRTPPPARRRGRARSELNARDLEIINRRADFINQEAVDA
ncbi:MAG: hypothetical protein M1546_03280 [Chloroflexi bacterium]|nr:hypothetical protein [Chloroflexota bacterium]